VITLEQVTKIYEQTVAVDHLSLEVQSGELLVLLGTSGCGKTTTLKMINRLIEPTSGHIYIDEQENTSKDVVTLRRSIGYVFQGIGLFTHLSVGENIGIAPKLADWSDEKRRSRVNELLELVHLPPEEFRERNPADLSGGQQQRVGVARALAIQPNIMLMDEPFGALDPLTRDSLQQEYLDIRKRFDITTIFVTHDMTEALLLGDRIAVMDAGKVLQIDTPGELLRNPANEYIEKLMSTPKKQADQLEKLANE